MKVNGVLVEIGTIEEGVIVRIDRPDGSWSFYVNEGLQEKDIVRLREVASLTVVYDPEPDVRYDELLYDNFVYVKSYANVIMPLSDNDPIYVFDENNHSDVFVDISKYHLYEKFDKKTLEKAAKVTAKIYEFIKNSDTSKVTTLDIHNYCKNVLEPILLDD